MGNFTCGFQLDNCSFHRFSALCDKIFFARAHGARDIHIPITVARAARSQAPRFSRVAKFQRIPACALRGDIDTCSWKVGKRLVVGCGELGAMYPVECLSWNARVHVAAFTKKIASLAVRLVVTSENVYSFARAPRSRGTAITGALPSTHAPPARRSYLPCTHETH